MAECKVVMQPRCVHCLKEQYVLAVMDVSHGNTGCTWCGRIAPVFYADEDYRAVLKERRSQDG
jgi:hypothetical protein